MKARYQYRIYPTDQQRKLLAQLFGCVRVVWNDALNLCKVSGGYIKPADLQKICITMAKKSAERSWLSDVSNIPLQQSINDLGAAYKIFFESLKRKGIKVKPPRFKKKSGRQSARFTRGGFSIKGNKVYLAKIGKLKTIWSRPLPFEPSSVTVIKNAAGQYFLSFVVEVEQISVEPVRPSVGVDFGIKTFAFLSTGEKVESPGYSRLDRKIRRFQRKLARQVKGSKRRERTRLRIAKLHLKVSNIRKDFLHKTTTKLIRENQTVCLENLGVAGMLKNRKLSRAISQQGWSNARTMCEAKAERYQNRCVAVVSRWEPTSQVCSCCGFRWGKLDLSVRSILCISCGAEHDRDENAARNIEKSGVELSQDSKWTGSGHKTSFGAIRDELSTHLEDKQLRLFAC